MVFLGDTASGGSFHQEAPLRARCLANVFPIAADALKAPTRPPEGGRPEASNKLRARATPGALLASSPWQALKV